MRVSLTGAALAVVLALATSPAQAQSTAQRCRGQSPTEQGAVMPGATVVIANVETGWTRHVVTDERGWYRATALTPGSYEVRARLQGFATQIRPRLTIRSGISEREGRVFGFHRGDAVQRGSLTASGSSSRRPSPGHRARL